MWDARQDAALAKIKVNHSGSWEDLVEPFEKLTGVQRTSKALEKHWWTMSKQRRPTLGNVKVVEEDSNDDGSEGSSDDNDCDDAEEAKHHRTFWDARQDAVLAKLMVNHSGSWDDLIEPFEKETGVRRTFKALRDHWSKCKNKSTGRSADEPEKAADGLRTALTATSVANPAVSLKVSTGVAAANYKELGTTSLSKTVIC